MASEFTQNGAQMNKLGSIMNFLNSCNAKVQLPDYDPSKSEASIVALFSKTEFTGETLKALIECIGYCETIGIRVVNQKFTEVTFTIPNVHVNGADQ